MKYRPEIDGLRTIAVTSVILFHAHFNFISGGFLGVDIFFVISGFLITTIITREVKEGKFSILKFYEKRARRILPALFTVMLFCIPFAWFMYTPSEFVDFGESLVAVSIFSSNILFFTESGYYDAISDYKPLLHTWSLAVEEQYYIFFPLLVMLLWRYGKKLLFGIICILFVISIIMAEYATRAFTTSASFYLLPTRFFEILLGGMITFIPIDLNQDKYKKSNQILSSIGFIITIAVMFVFDGNTPLPGVLTLVPIVGSAMIILFATKGTWVNTILSNKIMVFLGLISYSTYLWHQPLLAFAKYMSTGELGLPLIIGLIILTHVLSYISWRYIEKPFRNKTFLTQKQILSYSGVGLLAFIAVGAVITVQKGFENRAVVQKFNVANYKIDNTELRKETLNILREKTNNPKYDVVDCESDLELWYDLSDKDKQKLLLVGNSHAKDLFNVLSNSEDAKAQFQFARYGYQLKDLNERFYTSQNYKYADVIIICSLLSEPDFIKLNTTIIDRIQSDGKKVVLVKNVILSPDYGNRTLADFVIQRNLSAGINDYEVIKNNVNKAYYEYYEDNKDKYQFNKLNIDYIDKIKAKHKDVIIADRMDYIVSEEDKTYFAVNNNLEKFSPDSSHHTLEGAKFYGKRIDSIN